MDSIQVLKDTGATHDVDIGDLYRFSEKEVEVITDVYIGEHSSLFRFVEIFRGGKVEFVNQSNKTSFNFTATLDLSGNLTDYEFLKCEGKLVGKTIEVNFDQQFFKPDPKNPGKAILVDHNILEMILVTRGKTPDTDGPWKIDKLSVLLDTGDKHVLKEGMELLCEEDKVDKLFDVSFSLSGFAAQFPDFDILDHITFCGSGVAQGFLLAKGKPNTSMADSARLIMFDFINLGTGLQGNYNSLIVEGPKANEDLLFLELARASQTFNLRSRDSEHMDLLRPAPKPSKFIRFLYEKR